MMDHAKEIVEIVDRLRCEMLASSQDGTGTKMSESENAQMSEWLLQMGMTMPVTRQNTSAAAFHRELAREIADAVAAPLRSCRGRTMTMTDVYCLVNRARGTELVSPEDVIAATALWASLGIPFATRKLRKSGALVVVQRKAMMDDEGDAMDEEAIRELMLLPELQDFSGRGMTIDAIAMALDVAVMMAMEYVSIAEDAGRLCRDDQSSEGVAFYRNFF